MPADQRPIYASACVFYTALACVMTYPLIRHLGSVVPHDLGDPLLSTTILWWNAHTVPLTQHWWDGFAFYPATGMLAFSDHRLGESLLATPLQWLGASPITAHNLTLLATFPLCAITAHWLAFTLTRRHDAAAIAGLSFGFCPYRIAHLPQLELLAAFGMPAALAALHRYLDTRKPRWLAIFAIALVVLGLCSSYYLVFFSVLLALWLLWFVRPGELRLLGGILIAAACAFVALLPVIVGYSRIHAYYGLARPFSEILSLSADVTSYLTAHSTSLLWGWTARWARPEGELFPGATIALLSLVGAILAWRRHRGVRDRLERLSLWLVPIALVCAAIALCGWAYSPWRIAFAGVRISSDAPFKSMTVALLAVAIWLGASSRLRSAYARRSVFAFYIIATLFLALCSLGPKPTLAGHQFLYQPPYAWLMWFPVFDAMRAPARMGLPVMVTLATAGALAFNQLQLTAQTRRLLAAVDPGRDRRRRMDRPSRAPDRPGHLAAGARAGVHGGARAPAGRRLRRRRRDVPRHQPRTSGRERHQRVRAYALFHAAHRTGGARHRDIRRLSIGATSPDRCRQPKRPAGHLAAPARLAARDADRRRGSLDIFCDGHATRALRLRRPPGADCEHLDKRSARRSRAPDRSRSQDVVGRASHSAHRRRADPRPRRRGASVRRDAVDGRVSDQLSAPADSRDLVNGTASGPEWPPGEPPG